jgi:hypothetical protein
VTLAASSNARNVFLMNIVSLDCRAGVARPASR